MLPQVLRSKLFWAFASLVAIALVVTTEAFRSRWFLFFVGIAALCLLSLELVAFIDPKEDQKSPIQRCFEWTSRSFAARNQEERRSEWSLGREVLHQVVTSGLFWGYLAAGCICFILVSCLVEKAHWYNALFMSIGLLAGGDPYALEPDIQCYRFPQVGVWALAWIIHVASWLIIPALFSLIMILAVERAEKRRLRERQRAVRRYVGIAKLPPQDADKLEQDILIEFELEE